MYYVLVTLLLAFLIAGMGLGLAIGGRLPELENRDGRRRGVSGRSTGGRENA